LALGEHIGVNGRQIIDSLVLGIDVACRVGNAMYPDHYHRGWHITGSTGTLWLCGSLCTFNGSRFTKDNDGIGNRCLTTSRYARAVWHHDKAFSSWWRCTCRQPSALLAKHGFTASPKALEAGRGYMQTVSTKCDWSEIDRGLGKSFEISLNTYKPFACGIVIHPAIDACSQLRAQGVKAEDVERIELRVHPLVLELTGKESERWP
jgi:2-methylcitrate dehydratase PrpD